jgi:hypothetical protein
LLAWGWHELSFLTGWITGPRKTAIAARPERGPRFVEAVRAILWHELGILAVGLVIVAITWNAPNQVGTGTFVVLWVMRTSAKLNLFLGVRNLSEEFLPPHLRYMESFFRRRAVNLLFPVAVTAASLALALLVARAIDDNAHMRRPSAPRWWHHAGAGHRGALDAGAATGHHGLVALGHPRSRAPQHACACAACTGRSLLAIGIVMKSYFVPVEGGTTPTTGAPASGASGPAGRPTAVVIGSGFGGLAAAVRMAAWAGR